MAPPVVMGGGSSAVIGETSAAVLEACGASTETSQPASWSSMLDYLGLLGHVSYTCSVPNILVEEAPHRRHLLDLRSSRKDRRRGMRIWRSVASEPGCSGVSKRCLHLVHRRAAKV